VVKAPQNLGLHPELGVEGFVWRVQVLHGDMCAGAFMSRDHDAAKAASPELLKGYVARKRPFVHGWDAGPFGRENATRMNIPASSAGSTDSLTCYPAIDRTPISRSTTATVRFSPRTFPHPGRRQRLIGQSQAA
jgi:hypothetical protein